MSFPDIEKGSIQIVKRRGNRVELQCLKEDVSKLPTSGILSGSSCLILNAEGDEPVLYVFNKTKEEKTGKWYSM